MGNMRTCLYLQITHAADNDTLRGIAMDHCELFTDSGFPKGLHLVTTVDKIVMIQTVALHHVLL